MTEQQLLVPDEQTTALVPQQQTPMDLLQMAVQSGADVDKLEKLMDLQERWEAKQAAIEFGERLSSFQSSCPIIEKRREASFGGKHAYNYANLEDIMRAIAPLLKEHGLTIGFSAKIDTGMMTVDCKVSRGVHSEVSSTTLPIPSDMRVNDTQKMAAALSYAKRYALCAALNIVVGDEDIDGAGLDATPLDQSQYAALDELFTQLTAQRQEKFLDVYEVEKLADIPGRRYSEILAVLKKAV